MQNFDFIHKIDFLESFIKKLSSYYVAISAEEIKVDIPDIYTGERLF